MTIIYIAHATQITNKKQGGYSVKQVVYDSYTDPSKAHQHACDVIVQLLKKENYFTKKSKSTEKSKDTRSNGADDEKKNEKKIEKQDSEYERRKERVNDILNNHDPPAGKYYDLDDVMSKWSPDIPELNTKKYDVRVSESDLK